jgi:hypothetical protein
MYNVPIGHGCPLFPAKINRYFSTNHEAYLMNRKMGKV